MKTDELQATVKNTIEKMEEIINNTHNDMTKIQAAEAVINAVRLYMALADPKIKMNMNLEPLKMQKNENR